MRNNLHRYHTMLRQLCQWLPAERITRLRNLALFVTGLYFGATIHLPFIVRKWPTPGSLPSLVNRLRRFLDNERVSVRTYYHPIAKHLIQPFGGHRIRLLIDCTKVGTNHRVLTVAIAYRRRALPVVWSVHRGRKGHVTAREQVALLRYVASLLPPQSSVWLLGDSGCHSVALIRWLRRHHWHYVLRQPGHVKVCWAGSAWYQLATLALHPGETRILGWVRLTQHYNYGWHWGVLHWAQGEEEPWYLVSDCPDSTHNIRLYKIRMWIEEMYGDMKGHGFDLEATHLQDADRISRLLLGVCIVYVWLLTLGTWVVKRGFRPLVDRKDRRDKSYFRVGWDWIEHCCRLGQPFFLHFTPYL